MTEHEKEEFYRSIGFTTPTSDQVDILKEMFEMGDEKKS